MIIGIIGTKQSGKDTICKIIQAKYIYSKCINMNLDEEAFIKKFLSSPELQMYYLSKDDNWEKHAFADKLKKCLKIITGCSIENFESESFKNSRSTLIKDGHIWTYRELLQQLGTEVGRVIDKDIWIKALFKDYSEDKKWIIPDVRYENEANSIIAKGGILIRVTRGNPTNEHSSETGLINYDKVDYTIDNNGSIDDLIINILNLNI